MTAAADEPDAGRMAAALLRAATALVDDPQEARALVALTLSTARQRQGRAGPAAEAELFRLLRRAYHSVERSRLRRPTRDAQVASLARRQGPASARGAG